MKTKVILLLSVTVLILFSCKNTETNKKDQKQDWKALGALHISQTEPRPGDNLQLRYEPEKDSVNDDNAFSAYYYILKDDQVSAQDLKMNDSSGVWLATVSIPDSATAIAFNFKQGEEYNTNNNQGFVQPLYTKNGNPVAGAKASKAYFHMNLDSHTKTKTEPDSLLTWMQSDMKKDNGVRKKFNFYYANYLYQQDKQKGQAYVKKQMTAYDKNKDLSEEDYNTMVKLYGLNKNEKKADSLQKIAAKKYPKGQAAQRAYATKFSEAKTFDDKKEVFKDYEKNIGKDGRFKDYMLNTLAQNALKNDNIKGFQTYTSQLSNPRQIATIYNNTAWDMAQKDKNLDEAAEISKRSVDLMDSKANTGDKFKTWTESEYQNYLERVSEMYRDTYALILFKQEKTKEALDQQQKAVGKGLNPEINERYIQYLLAADNPKKAEEKAEEFIKEGEANAKIKTYFKTAYFKNKGSEKGYQENLAKLEEQARKKILASLKNDMMHKKSPDFHLTDKDGKPVNLSDLKGKIVVLDFWATWCGPCRDSFPGMEKAVNFYKDNPDVQFYFVNTFQSEKPDERHRKVTDFMAKNKYPFEVLFDETIGDSFLTASDYGITGIPTKIIIGPDGKWNFTKVGFGGSNAKLLNEIKMMVELAKGS